MDLFCQFYHHEVYFDFPTVWLYEHGVRVLTSLLPHWRFLLCGAV